MDLESLGNFATNLGGAVATARNAFKEDVTTRKERPQCLINDRLLTNDALADRLAQPECNRAERCASLAGNVVVLNARVERGKSRDIARQLWRGHGHVPTPPGPLPVPPGPWPWSTHSLPSALIDHHC